MCALALAGAVEVHPPKVGSCPFWAQPRSDSTVFGIRRIRIQPPSDSNAFGFSRVRAQPPSDSTALGPNRLWVQPMSRTSLRLCCNVLGLRGVCVPKTRGIQSQSASAVGAPVTRTSVRHCNSHTNGYARRAAGKVLMRIFVDSPAPLARETHNPCPNDFVGW